MLAGQPVGAVQGGDGAQGRGERARVRSAARPRRRAARRRSAPRCSARRCSPSRSRCGDGEQLVEQLAADPLLGLGDRALPQQQQRGDDRRALQDARPRRRPAASDEQHRAERLAPREHGRDGQRRAAGSSAARPAPRRPARRRRSGGRRRGSRSACARGRPPAPAGSRRRRARASVAAEHVDDGGRHLGEPAAASSTPRSAARASPRPAPRPRCARCTTWFAWRSSSSAGCSSWNSDAFSMAIAAWAASEASRATSSRLERPRAAVRREQHADDPVPAAQRHAEDRDQALVATPVDAVCWKRSSWR